MKSKTKSNALDYGQIYRSLLLAFTIFLLFIALNFFLPIANYISIFLLFLSLVFLAIHFYNKKLNYLMASFILCSLSLILVVAFLYIK